MYEWSAYTSLKDSEQDGSVELMDSQEGIENGWMDGWAHGWVCTWMEV